MASNPELAQTSHVEAADGRRLRAEVVGDGRRVVLVQVGSPNAGALYRDWVQDAADRGLTLITYDRPGYRGSSRQLGRTVADCAADVATIGSRAPFDAPGLDFSAGRSDEDRVDHEPFLSDRAVVGR